MRAFTQLRSMLATHEDLKRKIEIMEQKYDEQFRIVFEAISQLIEENEMPRKKIGYIKEGQTKYGKRSRKNYKIHGKLWSQDVIQPEIVN